MFRDIDEGMDGELAEPIDRETILASLDQSTDKVNLRKVDVQIRFGYTVAVYNRIYE